MQILSDRSIINVLGKIYVFYGYQCTIAAA